MVNFDDLEVGTKVLFIPVFDPDKVVASAMHIAGTVGVIEKIVYSVEAEIGPKNGIRIDGKWWTCRQFERILYKDTDPEYFL